MGMEIDSLEVAIQAQAQDASKQIDTLYGKLGSLAKALNGTAGSYRKTATEVGRVTAAIRSLASIRIPNFNGLIQQLETLSRINLTGLANKKINIDVEVNAPKSASQVQWAIEKAADAAKANSDKIADQLINEYALKGKARDSMRAAVSEMMKELSSGFDGSVFANAGDVLDKYIDVIGEKLREQGRILANAIGDEEALSSALNGKTDFVAGKVDLNKVRSKISEINNPEVAQAAESAIFTSITSAINNSMDGIKGAFTNAMKIAAGQIPLDIEVNQNKIVRDIQNAINRAASVEYKPVEVKLSVNKQNISDNVSKELQNISAGNLTQISDAYEKLFQSIMKVHGVLDRSNPINSLVNALTRLGNVDLREFDTNKFNEIAATISSLGALGDVAANVGKMVSALARLANVGSNVEVTANALPALGNALKDAFEKIGSANVSEATERVLGAFTRLATSGQKAQAASQNLPNVTQAIIDFFNAMTKAPEVNANTVSMVQAFSQIATAGKNINVTGNQVQKSFDGMKNAGERLNKAFKEIKAGTKHVKDAFKSLSESINKNVKGIGKGIAKICSHFKKIGKDSKHINKATISLKNLLQVALGFYGIRSIFNWGKEAVEFASDLTEVQNVVENSFGTQGTKNVEEFAKSAKDSFGMTELTAKKVAARYQAMGNAMGITAGQVAEATQRIAKNLNPDLYDTTGEAMGAMSINLTKLAADMASFYNVEQDTVAEALNAVYTGQTRPLRQYGLDLTQATLEEWAHKQGIEGKISAMSQAEKTMLRYQYVLAQTTTVQGDFTRTADTWANQVRLLKQNLQALGGVVGSTLINAFKPLISWLNVAISSVTSFAETVGNALGKIFGWKILHTPASNAADAYNTLSEGLDEAGSSGEDAAGGINDATKAAEDYKNTVLGFDELNKLNDVKDPTSSSGKGKGSGDGDGGSGIPSADGTGADFQIIKQDSWMEAYKSNIDSLFELGRYISDTLTKAMESIKWNEIYEKARNFGTGLASFLNGLITPELFSAIGGTIAGAVNTVLNAADAFLDKFDFTNLGNSLGAGINRFFTDWDAGLTASVFYKAINGIMDALKAEADTVEWNSIGTKIGDCVNDALGGIEWEEKVFPAMESFGTDIADFLNGIISPETFGTIGDTIANAINAAMRLADAFLNKFDFTNLGTSLGTGISNFFKTWDAKLTADVFTKTVNGIADAIKAATDKDTISWNSIGDKISTCIRTALGGIQWKEKVYPAADSFGTSLAEFLNGLIKPSTFWTIGQTVAGRLNTALHILDSFGSTFDFANFGQSIASAIQGFFEDWDAELTADTFNKLASGILTSISTAIGDVKWERIGAKIAGMLANIEWLELLKQVGNAIMTAVNGVLDLATGLFDGTPLVNVFKKLKERINGIAENMDLPSVASGISDIVTALTPAVSGFAQGFIDVFGKLGELGATAIRKIGEALQIIADALNSVDPAILETVGSVLGKIAGSLVAISLADKGVTAVGTLIGTITGTGVASGVAATATQVGAVGTAVGEAGTNATKAANPISSLVKWFVTTADPAVLAAGGLMSLAESIDTARFHAAGGKGSITDFYQAVEGMRGVLSDDLTNKLQGLAIEFANNGIEGEEAAKKLAEFFTNEKIDPATIELALSNVSESIGDANPFIDTIRQSFTLMGDDAVEAAKKVAMTDSDYANLRTSIADLAAEYGLSVDEQEIFYTALEQSKSSSSTAEQAYQAVRDQLVLLYGDTDEGKAKIEAFDKAVQDHVPNAFGSIETGAKNADDKTGIFKGNLFGFAGGIAAQALLMAVMGTTFKAMGDKADESKTPVDNLKKKVGDFVTAVAGWSSDALKNSKNVGKNVPKGMEEGIKDAKASLDRVLHSTLIDNPEKDIKAGWGINSPSTVTYDYGENIVAGMENAISEKGSSIVDALSTILTNAQTAITGTYQEFSNAGTDIATNFRDGMESVSFSDVVDSWNNDMNFSSFESDMYSAGREAAQEFSNGMQSVYLPKPHLNFEYSVTGDDSSGYSYSYSTSIDWYAKGGFPNMGELFMANENGIEMMGRMGHRNVVANNQQITDGIKAAVVDGMMEVFMATNSQQNEQPIVVNAVLKTENDEVLARAVERGRARRDARFNTVGYSYG